MAKYKENGHSHFIKGPFNNEMATGLAIAAIQALDIVNDEFEDKKKVTDFSIAIAEISINGTWYQVQLGFKPKKSDWNPINEVVRP